MIPGIICHSSRKCVQLRQLPRKTEPRAVARDAKQLQEAESRRGKQQHE
jgi:hypothetical protein